MEMREHFEALSPTMAPRDTRLDCHNARAGVTCTHTHTHTQQHTHKHTHTERALCTAQVGILPRDSRRPGMPPSWASGEQFENNAGTPPLAKPPHADVVATLS